MGARGLTLLEVLIGLALFAIITAITVPLVVSQTRKLTWEEVLTQIERRSAVTRGDAQRRSEPVWFEARWIESERLWALGTRTMGAATGEGLAGADELSGVLLGEVNGFMEDDPVGPQSSLVEEPATMTDFEVALRLPAGFEMLRALPDELLDMRDRSAAPEAEDLGLEPVAFLAREGVEFEAEPSDAFDDSPTRMLVAVFLPDGTLIGPERLYVRSPQGRMATLTPSRWLGSVKCETLTLGDLMSTAPVEEEPMPAPEPEEPAMPGAETGS